MQVICPRCGQVATGSAIDLANNRAICRPCGELFTLPTASAGALAVAEAHRPADLQWSEQMEGRVSRMQLSPPRGAAIPILGFAAVWDVFLLNWYHLAFSGKNTPWLMFVFPMLHVGAGVFITWWGLVKALNSSRFTIDGESFELRNGPIPERGARESTRNIDRFDVQENRGNRSSSWTLRMLTADGRAVSVSLPIDAQPHLMYVAARLNAALASVREPQTYRG